MPMMKSPFDQVLASTTGHRIEAKEDAPIYIPDNCVRQAMGQGFKVTDEAPKVVAPVETSDNDEDGEETLSLKFDVALDQALIRIITRDDPSDLKADLTPKSIKVASEMSPDLRRPTATEISNAYQRLQENINLASE